MAAEPNALDAFLPAVRRWFLEELGRPTPPQSSGWPSIRAGEHTLIIAPTGSGKTLAAFLAALDLLWRTPRVDPGVRILYVSPLKALGNDVKRNLQRPLDGIRERSELLGAPLPRLSVGIRTGDTSAGERQRLARKPPDILITTPESLHLMLTSRARSMLTSVSHLIVDEIHAVCGNKRGVFLSLLIERLEALTPKGFVRVGLSATAKPLDEIACFLGGLRRVLEPDGSRRFEPRPVQVVDEGYRKTLDIETDVSFGRPSGGPPGSVWPAIEDRLYRLIREHRSTIVFANNRRVVERLASALNSRSQAEPGRPATPLARAHHGSMSVGERGETEELLKKGELAAVVATASLELGIDMGSVDLVCQVESPGSVSRALQRVGRSGHLVGSQSKGRMIAKSPADLLEAAALSGAMLEGDIETTRTPRNCLDLLAQQVIACVAVEPWEVPRLFELVRSAYPYRDLSSDAFESVLKLVSGRYSGDAIRDLAPRVSWDRVNNRLLPLPGSARLAIVGGGSIPDTGQYPFHLGEGGPKLGELDEEFVLERRVGESFMLGSATWLIEDIDPLRVIVSRATGADAIVPFWRGEATPRTIELGKRVGELCRRISKRSTPERLSEAYKLTPAAAEALVSHVERQRRVSGTVPSDKTVLIETYQDEAGELGLAILTPFGGRLHHALKLAILGRIYERLGVSAACLHGDDGLIFRLPGLYKPPLDLLDDLDADEAERLIRERLADSPLFGLRFRQNAGRALLMPRARPGKRAPLYLQRLRAKDLLQVTRRIPDHPIVIETYRECLEDDLEIGRLREFLDKLACREIEIVRREGVTPSPFVSELLFRFAGEFLYEWDQPRGKDSGSSGDPSKSDLLDSLLEPEAIRKVDSRLRGARLASRTPEEMAERLRIVGDLSPSELLEGDQTLLDVLAADGRATRVRLEGVSEPSRWILAEDASLYRIAFGTPQDEAAITQIVRRHVGSRALIGIEEVLARYPIDVEVASEILEAWVEEGGLSKLAEREGSPSLWAERSNLAEVKRISIGIRRGEFEATRPEVFADFIARRHFLHPEHPPDPADPAGAVLDLLGGFAATVESWESLLLPRRIDGYRSEMLDDAFRSGSRTWRAVGNLVAIFSRSFEGGGLSGQSEPLGEEPARLLERLRSKGAAFLVDLARSEGLSPGSIRVLLDQLLRRGLVRNDGFEPLRPDSPMNPGVVLVAAADVRRGVARVRRGSSIAESRWEAIPETDPSSQESLRAWTDLLFERHGVLSREILGLETSTPAWSDLSRFLSREELRGTVRRGYFVEGLSGAQFAKVETLKELAELGARSRREPDGPAVLVNSTDPANLYGSSAPFDIPLLEGGTTRLIRTPSNELVLIGGRPILIIEGSGRRLTALGSASDSDLRKAVSALKRLVGPRRRILRVERFGDAAVLGSPAEFRLADAGFVRDFSGMTLYFGEW